MFVYLVLCKIINFYKMRTEEFTQLVDYNGTLLYCCVVKQPVGKGVQLEKVLTRRRVWNVKSANKVLQTRA